MSKNEIFEAHPKLDCYFETSDGSCFYTENAAEAHSKTLKDKKVKTVVKKSTPVEAKAETASASEEVNNSKAVEDNASKEVVAADNKK